MEQLTFHRSPKLQESKEVSSKLPRELGAGGFFVNSWGAYHVSGIKNRSQAVSASPDRWQGDPHTTTATPAVCGPQLGGGRALVTGTQEGASRSPCRSGADSRGVYRTAAFAIVRRCSRRGLSFGLDGHGRA